MDTLSSKSAVLILLVVVAASVLLSLRQESPREIQEDVTGSVYRDSELGFEFVYPARFTVQKPLPSPCNGVRFQNPNLPVSTTTNEIVSFDVFVDPATSCTMVISSRYSFYKQPAQGYELLGEESRIIGKIEFAKKNYIDIPPDPVYFEADGSVNTMYPTFRFSAWETTYAGRTYIFIYNNGMTANPEGKEQEFENILSTLRFVE